MREAQVRRLPVIDDQQKLCGIVSLSDLMQKADSSDAEQALEGVSQPGGQHRQ
jgi:CBS-domain-containing membrane protein